MAENSKIEWTDHTFNPWWGCVKVSPGCTNCYAATFDARTFGVEKHVTAKGETREPHWGKDAPRRFFGEKHWREPLKWNRDAERDGARRRVFCASMADVFEDREDLREQRDRLFALIHATKSLDWLLLTKRPERVTEIVPESWCDGFPRNVWLGTTCEDQQLADERIPHLLAVPATVRFLSVEPMLGPVDLRVYLGAAADVQSEDGDDRICVRCGDGVPPESELRYATHRCPGGFGPRPDWVIVGGESGGGARACDVAWIRSVRDQCREASVACFVKQLGARPIACDGLTWRGLLDPPAAGQEFRTADAKGGDPAEWPEDLRVREFPAVRP